MDRKQSRRIASLTVGLTLVLATGLSRAATIGWNPADLTVPAGSPFDLTLVGSGFTDGAGGSTGGGLNVSWTQGVIDLLSVDLVFPGTGGGGPGDLSNPGTIDNGAGTLTGLSAANFVGTPNPSFDIAVLHFSAVQAGLSSTGLIQIDSINQWADQFATLLATQPGTTPGNVNVSAVPLPPAVFLFGSALAGLGFVGRRKKAAAASATV